MRAPESVRKIWRDIWEEEEQERHAEIIEQITRLEKGPCEDHHWIIEQYAAYCPRCFTQFPPIQDFP